jgi:cytochrome P450
MNPTLEAAYDPSDEATRRNPFPLYEALQERDPVHWSAAARAWIVTRYDDVRQTLMTPQTMSSDRLRPFYESLKDERRDILSGVMRYLNQWVVFKSPPEHTRIRRLLNAVFTPDMVRSLEPQIRGTVRRLLESVDTTGEVDFVQDVAVPLPAYVILDMLGLPREDFAAIKLWSDQLRLFIGGSRGDDEKYRKAREGADHMSAYFREAIERRRSSPASDVISRMIAARDEDGQLSEDELVATCMLLLFGGHETTTNLLGGSVVALLDHPDQLQRLRENPQMMDSAVEEFLRYDGPSNGIGRVVAVDHELCGTSLKAGERVYAMINAANRDPRRFERPHELDIGRTPNRHLTFGQGLHFCLGAPLARLEGKVCVQELIGRFPALRYSGAEVEWVDAIVMRGPTRLPLRLD